LFEVARQKGLEGILAKKRDSIYQERRSSEWLKIKFGTASSARSADTPSPKAAVHILDRLCSDSTISKAG